MAASLNATKQIVRPFCDHRRQIWTQPPRIAGGCIDCDTAKM